MGKFNPVGWIRAGWDWLIGRRRAKAAIVSFDDNGVQLGDAVVGWEKIDRVVAYKRDCYTVGLICLAFLDRDGVVLLEVDEGAAGYQELVDGMPQHLVGCLSMGEWFMEVAFPAFEVNLTELYRRVV